MTKRFIMGNMFKSVFIIIFFIPMIGHAQSQDTLLVTYDVWRCDSLVQANAQNPDFVILDVRRDSEYNPAHLAGAIQRDFFHADFQDMLDALPRHKFYLVHCASGSRSTQAFNIMVDLGFYRVVNMQGGINAWKAAGLPTTTELSPLTMAISETLICGDTIPVATIDTIELALTNRANDTLYFTSVTALDGTEFSTNFDLDRRLLGAEDYTFQIYYEPFDDVKDSIDFVVSSNGGDVTFTICRTGELVLSADDFPDERPITFYPNPARNTLHIESAQTTLPAEILILDMNGKIMFKDALGLQADVDVSGLVPGMYSIRLYSEGRMHVERFVKVR